jgi:hypothetical protein
VSMKSVAAIALVVISMALPACAQRGSGHGGSSGHSGFSGGGARGFRGGFSAGASGRYAGSSGRSGGRGLSMPRGFQRPGMGAYRGGTPYRGLTPLTGSWRYRRPYISPFRTGFGYGFPGWGAPYYLSAPDFDDYDDDSSGQQSSYGYDQQPDAGEQEPDQPLSPYAPAPYPGGPYAPAPYPGPSYPGPSYSAPSAGPHSRPAPAKEQAVTLVFKDGRQPEQIHNYLMTANTLYVEDPRHREIPIDELDLAATAKLNREAGVDFALPGASR